MKDELEPFDISGRWITIHPKSGWSIYKDWALENWEEIIRRIHQSYPGVAVVQIGVGSDPRLAGVDHDLRGATSIAQALWLVKNSVLHLGVDSFTNHAAGAFEHPAVILFGSTSPTGSGYASATNLWAELSCSPCYREDPKLSRADRGACINPPGQEYDHPRHACMAAITVEAVWGGVGAFMGEASPSAPLVTIDECPISAPLPRKAEEPHEFQSKSTGGIFMFDSGMKIIASMTTIPSRISLIRPVIDAVLSQSVPIEHIEINIPWNFIRTSEEYQIPDWLEATPHVHIHRTQDFGAITKVAPTLLRHKNDADTYIWSVDDDCAYPSNQLELLMAAHDPGKRRVLTRYGGNLRDDGTLQNLFGSLEVTFLEGFGGVLYPPSCIQDDFARFLEIVSQSPDCRMSDDIVLSLYFNKSNTPIFLHNPQSEIVPYMVSGWLPHSKLDALSADGHAERYKRVYQFINSLDFWKQLPSKLELGCGRAPTSGYIHHDRRKHSPYIDVEHNLDILPWPWANESLDEILAIDVFEHLNLMPDSWLQECHRLLKPGGVLRLRVPVFGSPWHIIDPTHVRGFHHLNFDYFIEGRELWQKYGNFYFDFSFQNGDVTVEGYNIVATLTK